MESCQFGPIASALDRIASALEMIAAAYTTEAQPVNDEPVGVDEIFIEAAREEIVNAYNDGKIIEYNPIGDPLAGWIQAHRTASPHRFEWDDNYYRLPPARR